jgi:23S rRNA (uracil1939-C5)-methyltransferase
VSSWPEVEIELNALAYGGEAVGRLQDGRAVFVPFALPGERVRARVIEDKKRYARAELLEVLNPSPERIEPRCVHFGLCGGCHFQHLPYEIQVAAKVEILKDQLRRIGKIENAPVLPPVYGQPWNYRNHVQFHLTSRGELGYYTHLGDRVFRLQECHLPETPINQVWPQLDFEGFADLERVGLRLGAGDDLQLILEGQDVQPPELAIEELPLSAIHISPAGTLVLAGSPATYIEVLGREFRVSAGSFFQVNTGMAERMVLHLLEHIPQVSETLVDAYCGAGLFSAFLAPRSGRLVCIESSPDACEDFTANLDEFDNVELYEAPVEEALLALELKPDVMLVDPPRSGLDPRVIDGISRCSPATLAYVSCDVATLARDAGRLARVGYRLEKITPFDLFPQSYHLETISLWERE